MKNEVVAASITKRVGSAIMDAIIIVLFMILLQSWAVVPISEHIYHVSDMQKEYAAKIVDTGLFVDVKGTTYELNNNLLYDYKTGYTILDDKKTQISVPDFYEPYFAKFINTEYANNKVVIDEKKKADESNMMVYKDYYRTQHEASNLFTTDAGGKVTLKEGVTAETAAKFYMEQYNKAFKALYYPGNDVSNMVLKIQNINLVGAMISLSITLIIFTLIIPLCRKDGETIGKMMLGIGVSSRKDGFRITKWQTVIRFLAFFFLEIAFSVLIGNFAPQLVGLPLIASFTVVVFSKSHAAIHDFCAATFVVDKTRCLIYKNMEEFKEHMSELQAIDEKDSYITEASNQFEYIDKDNFNSLRSDKTSDDIIENGENLETASEEVENKDILQESSKEDEPQKEAKVEENDQK